MTLRRLVKSFHYFCCITPNSVTRVRRTSPYHCAQATQFFSKCYSCVKPLEHCVRFHGLRVEPPAPQTNARPTVWSRRLSLSKWSSSLVYFTTRLKVRRQETAIRRCGHPGQLHLSATLHSYRHKLNLVMEPPKKIKINKKNEIKIKQGQFV